MGYGYVINTVVFDCGILINSFKT